MRIVGTEAVCRRMLLLFTLLAVLPPGTSAADSHLCCATFRIKESSKYDYPVCTVLFPFLYPHYKQSYKSLCENIERSVSRLYYKCIIETLSIILTLPFKAFDYFLNDARWVEQMIRMTILYT